MPIETNTKLEIFDQERFQELDRKLMAMIFDVHNQFGRFFDETLYKAEIAARWMDSGLGTAEREVRITASHGTFRKDYLMDLFFNHTVSNMKSLMDHQNRFCSIQTYARFSR
jgi:hypothetical protein